MPKPRQDFNWHPSLTALVRECNTIIEENYPIHNFARGEGINTSAVIRSTLLFLADNTRKLKKADLKRYLDMFRVLEMNDRITISINDDMREAVQRIGDAIADLADWKGLRFSRQAHGTSIYNHLLIFFIALHFFIAQHQ